jgi:hypothetical protein
MADTFEEFIGELAKEILANAERATLREQARRFNDAGLGISTLGLVTPQGIVRVDCAGFPIPSPSIRQ